jgi:hypothetical protein
MQDRVDFYTPIHKAYRAFMCDTLVRVGCADVDDAEGFDQTLRQVEALLSSLRHHARHEDEFIHPLLVRAGETPSSAAEHAIQAADIAVLEALVSQIRSAPRAAREGMALRLYRRLGVFVAANLEHMLAEEVDNNVTLWAHYLDAQLVAMHDAMVASIEPPVFMEIMAWMLPALTPRELVQVMQGTRAGAPAPVFDALMSLAARTLPAPRYQALRAQLQRPAAASAPLGRAA